MTKSTVLQEDLNAVATSGLPVDKYRNRTFLVTGATGLIGSLTSTLTSFFLSRHKHRVSDPLLNTVKDELDRFDELTPAEVERLCEVLKAMKKK